MDVCHHLVPRGAGDGTRGFLQASQTLLTSELHPHPRCSILFYSLSHDLGTVHGLEDTTSLMDLKDFVVPTYKYELLSLNEQDFSVYYPCPLAGWRVKRNNRLSSQMHWRWLSSQMHWHWLWSPVLAKANSLFSETDQKQGKG